MTTRIFVHVMDDEGRICGGMVTTDNERAKKFVRHHGKVGNIAIIQRRPAK